VTYRRIWVFNRAENALYMLQKQQDGQNDEKGGGMRELRL
jgi:hypothetical protein